MAFWWFIQLFSLFSVLQSNLLIICLTLKEMYLYINNGPNNLGCVFIKCQSCHFVLPITIIASELAVADSTFTVTLMKGTRGLGLSVTGGVDTEEPWPGLIRIKRLFPHQPAWQSGQLAQGDFLLVVNNTSLVGLTNYVSTLSITFSITFQIVNVMVLKSV